MLKNKRHVTTIVAVLMLVLVNLVALRWSWKYFQQSAGVRVRYGDRMPALGGADYTGRGALSLDPADLNLVFYLSGDSLNGRAVAALKSAEELQRVYGARGLKVSVITASAIADVQELVEGGFVTYKIINDSEGVLARRLGLGPGEKATFLFEKGGACKFSIQQEPNSDDLRQLLAAEGVAPADADAAPQTVVKGQPLPPWTLVEARTLKRQSVGEVAAGRPRQWVFFPADCFSCGMPGLREPMAEYEYWRKSLGEGADEPVLIFDSAFLPDSLLRELSYRHIKAPIYIANDELTPLARLAQARGKRVGRPMLVSTDASGAVTTVSMVKPPDTAATATEASDAQAAGAGGRSYREPFENMGLDVYDVDSHDGLYVVSERSRNSVLVIDGQLSVRKVIGGIGSGPGRLFRPGHLNVASDGVIYVQDGGNERIQSFDFDGHFLGGFQTTQYMGFAAGAGGEVYLGQPERGALVTVYSRDGRVLRSFGKTKTLSEVYGTEQAARDEQFRNAINRVHLTVDADGSVLVNFALAPILQKYTRQGELVFERRLEGPEVDALTQEVLSEFGGQHLVMSLDGFPERLMSLEAVALPGGEINVVLIDGSIYVADAEGRKVGIVRPRARQKFTPEMTGVSPAGELMLVGLTPRDCYLLPRQAD
jgi:DNA-binding beta-propeller fold protein YncE